MIAEQNNYTLVQDRESIRVLNECIDLQMKKSRDYQNPTSRVKQADYYLRGIESIYDMLHTKMLRIMSLMETAKSANQERPNFESMEDTLKDLINYASFGVAYLRGKVDGQVSGNDIFNRRVIPTVSNDPHWAMQIPVTAGMVTVPQPVGMIQNSYSTSDSPRLSNTAVFLGEFDGPNYVRV